MTQSEIDKIKKLSKIEQEAIEEFKNRLVEKLGDDLVMLKLYGSKARGDWHKDSDIDLLAVIKKNSKIKLKKNQIFNLEYGIMEKYNFKIILSTITYSLSRYLEDSSPPTSFMYEVNREGFDLWKNQNISKLKQAS